MKLNLQIPVNDTGYGRHGFYTAKTLIKLGVDLTIQPIGPTPITELGKHPELLRAMGQAKDPATPSLKIFHQWTFDKDDKIGFTVWELDRLSERDIKSLQNLEHIIVASEWARQIVLNHLPNKRVSVVPLGVDNSIFNPAPNFISDESCRFINIGKLEERKGQRHIVEVFNETFNSDDKVELILSCYNPFIQPAEYNKFVRWARSTRMGRADRIIFMGWLPTQEHLAHLINTTHCGIFLPRAEGFNLEAVECMACGLHVILPNYSGHTAYATNKNADLIHIYEKEWANDGRWFFGKEGMWAKIEKYQKEQAGNYMRRFYERWKNEEDLTNYEGLKTAQELSWENVTQKLIEIIE